MLSPYLILAVAFSCFALAGVLILRTINTSVNKVNNDTDPKNTDDDLITKTKHYNAFTEEYWDKVAQEACERHQRILDFAKGTYDRYVKSGGESFSLPLSEDIMNDLVSLNVQLTVKFNYIDDFPGKTPGLIGVAIGSYSKRGAGEAVLGKGDTFHEAFKNALDNALQGVYKGPSIIVEPIKVS